MQEGKLTVIVGCMFASKTETLVSLIRKEEYRKRQILCFKPKRDSRYSEENLVSHNKTSVKAIPAENAASIEEFIKPGSQYTADTTSIAIDEVQFFDSAVAPLCSALALDGYRVFVAGLDLDSFGHPFGCVPELLAYADEVIKLHAQCVICGRDATRTFRKPEVTKNVVHVGGAEDYQSMCIKCWKES